MDDRNAIFYLIGYNFTDEMANLIGISTITGAVTSNVELPFAESGFVGVGQAVDFDPTTGDIIATGRLTSSGPHTVLRMNAKTGIYKVIADVDGGDVLGAATCFNPVTSTEYLEFATNDTFAATYRRMAARLTSTVDNVISDAASPNRLSIDLYGVDTKSGKVEHIIEDPEVGKVLTTMQFDPKTRTIIGLGYHIIDGKFHRTMERFDPVAKAWSQIAELPDCLMESGGVSALDVVGRVLYVIMQKTGALPSDPWYLLGLNADTGKAVSNVILCRDFPACPWSLEFAN